jgi:creatinine amidohydrolase
MGISYHHMPFPGTITLRPQTLINIIRDICSSMKKHGIKKFLLLNAHGGNTSTLDIATKILHDELNIEVAQVKYTALAPESIAKYVHSKEYGHSCEREVSEALYLIPEIVKKNCIEKGKTIKFPIDKVSPVSGGPFTIGYSWDQKSTNGALGDATLASKEIGKEICTEALDNLEKFIKEFKVYKN